MSDIVKPRLNVGTALVSTVLTSIVILAGLAFGYGAYAKQTEVNFKNIERLESQKADKVELQAMHDQMNRIEANVQKLTDHLINNKRK